MIKIRGMELLFLVLSIWLPLFGIGYVLGAKSLENFDRSEVVYSYCTQPDETVKVCGVSHAKRR